MYKYNKKVLKSENINIFNQDYIIYVLDDKDYFNIHIVNDEYKDEEDNTLLKQEPKKHITLEDLDEVYLYEEVVKFALWNKFYGYKDSLYIFDIIDNKEPLEV